MVTSIFLLKAFLYVSLSLLILFLLLLFPDTLPPSLPTLPLLVLPVSLLLLPPYTLSLSLPLLGESLTLLNPRSECSSASPKLMSPSPSARNRGSTAVPLGENSGIVEEREGRRGVVRVDLSGLVDKFT